MPKKPFPRQKLVICGLFATPIPGSFLSSRFCGILDIKVVKVSKIIAQNIWELHTVVANWDETAVKLKCRKNHWEYENKQYTIEKSVESATRNAKKNF